LNSLPANQKHALNHQLTVRLCVIL
jgi:hypothetical protein